MQFEDPRTIEIMVNPNGTLWVEKLGEPMRCLGDIKPELTRSIIDTVAGFYGLICNQQHPIIEGNFPLDGSRFEGIIPPCTPAPMFDIRKKAKAIFTLDDYVKNGVLSASQRQVIAELVVKRRNILVVGGTGSGKTTLCNAVIAEMVRLTPNDRIDIIEDTPEIQCAAPNCTPTQTSEQVGMSQLLRAALRLRPDHFSAPPTPYLVRTACGDILEVPLSVTPLLRRLPALLGRLPSALRQPAVGSFSRWGALALLPVEHPLRVMQYMTRRFVAAGGRILSLTWHSSEMMPGGAPHMPDEGHVTRFLEKIKKYIEWLPTIGDLRSVTMQEIRRELTVCPAPLPPATADWSVLPTEPFSDSPP